MASVLPSHQTSRLGNPPSGIQNLTYSPDTLRPRNGRRSFRRSWAGETFIHRVPRSSCPRSLNNDLRTPWPRLYRTCLGPAQIFSRGGGAQAHDPAHNHGMHTEPVHLSTHCIEASDDEAWSILLTFLSTSKAVTQNSFQSNLAPHAPSHENIGSLASRYLYINKTPPIHQFTRVIKKKHRRHRKKMCVTRPQESNPRAKCYAIHAMLILSLTLAHIR